jgi:hypothetical protein
VAGSYLSCLINEAKNKFGATGNNDSKISFNCLDSKSSSREAQWLRGLKDHMIRIDFERTKEAGEDNDSGCSPIYIEKLRRIIQAYAREGSAASATRKFAILSHRQAAGRSAELSWLSYEKLEYNEHFTCIFANWPQPKASKSKTVAFLAGPNKEMCFFKNWGDRQALLGSSSDSRWEDDGCTWLCDDLQVKKPGSKLGDYIRAVGPR